MIDRLIELQKRADAYAVRVGAINYNDANAARADYLIANGVTVQEWISVEDRLPDNDQTVLCFNYNGEYKVLRWNYIDWKWNSGIEWLREDYVLFWMPLPQPPKGRD